MKECIYTLLFFSLMVSASYAENVELLNSFPTNMVQRNQNTAIDHVIKATLIHYSALAPTNIIMYAHAVGQASRRTDGDVTINKISMSFRNIGRAYAPEETPKNAMDRLNYLSTWIAVVEPIETLLGPEINSPIWVIARETPAFAANEVPCILFPAMQSNDKPVVVGLKEIEPEQVKRVLSFLGIWRRDKRVFYQEALNKKDEKEGLTLWENINTLSLPEGGPFYLIVDVALEKKAKSMLDRFENERKFQKRIDELETRTNNFLRGEIRGSR